jgi:hypothetical protein
VLAAILKTRRRHACQYSKSGTRPSGALGNTAALPPDYAQIRCLLNPSSSEISIHLATAVALSMTISQTVEAAVSAAIPKTRRRYACHHSKGNCWFFSVCRCIA